MFESDELSHSFVENLDTTDELIIDLEENVLADDAIVAAKTDEVKSMFGKLQSSSKVKESNKISFSSQQDCQSGHPMEVHTAVLHSKSIAKGERREELEDQSGIHVEETRSSRNSVIFEEDQQELGTSIQVGLARDFAACVPRQGEEMKLAPEGNQPLSTRPLRKRSYPEANKQLEGGKHPMYQSLSHMEETDTEISSKAVTGRLLRQMKCDLEKLPDSDLSNPRKRRQNNAALTAAKNTQISEERPKRIKRQSGSVAITINHVANPSEDSKQAMNMREMMKDMSKWMPTVVLERVTIPRNAVLSRTQLGKQKLSCPNEAQQASSKTKASLEQGDNCTPTELDSAEPIAVNCLTLEVFLSGDQVDNDKKPCDTNVRQSTTKLAVVSKNLDSISNVESHAPEDNKDSAVADSPALILDVNLDISSKEEGHIELQDVKVSVRKTSASAKEKKVSPEVKPLRGRRGTKVVALEPVGQETIASRRFAASPSDLDVDETTGNALPTSVEKTSLAKEAGIPKDAAAAASPENTEIPDENQAASIVVEPQEVSIVDIRGTALNETNNLTTRENPTRIRRGRASIAPFEPAIRKTNNEITNHGLALKQINVKKSTSTVKNYRHVDKATSSSVFPIDSKLYVQMIRTPEVEALAAAMKLEGSKTNIKYPRRHITNPFTSPGIERVEESSSATTGARRTRDRKKSF